MPLTFVLINVVCFTSNRIAAGKAIELQLGRQTQDPESWGFERDPAKPDQDSHNPVRPNVPVWVESYEPYSTIGTTSASETIASSFLDVSVPRQTCFRKY
eukprot:scaffold1051_cov119-Cylindrotheca_fusiformis.AAC.3